MSRPVYAVSQVMTAQQALAANPPPPVGWLPPVPSDSAQSRLWHVDLAMAMEARRHAPLRASSALLRNPSSQNTKPAKRKPDPKKQARRWKTMPSRIIVSLAVGREGEEEGRQRGRGESQARKPGGGVPRRACRIFRKNDLVPSGRKRRRRPERSCTRPTSRRPKRKGGKIARRRATRPQIVLFLSFHP